jgi:nitrate/TMAO reductase-like tetraheme cytochrome c subunit
MFSKISGTAIVVLLLGIFYRCSTALQLPSAADAHRSGVSLDTLVKGRELYIKSCGACHNLYLPNIHSANEWAATMKTMQKPSKISDKQAAIILKYISSVCKKEN